MNSITLKRKINVTIFRNQLLNEALTVVSASFLIALGAQICIPLSPVPVALQNFMVFFVVMALGLRLGFSAVVLYLCAGLVGLPVFVNFLSGPIILFGPRAGYLFGYLLVAVIGGYLSEKGWAARWWSTALAVTISSVAQFACGYFVLSLFIGFKKAYLLGVAPFYVVEVIKIVILSYIVPRFWKTQT